MYPTGRGVKVWWKETTYPREIPSSFCLNSLSLPLCSSPSEVPLPSGRYVNGGRFTLEAVSSYGDIARQGHGAGWKVWGL